MACQVVVLEQIFWFTEVIRPPSFHFSLLRRLADTPWQDGVLVFAIRSAPSEDWWRWRESNPRPEIWL